MRKPDTLAVEIFAKISFIFAFPTNIYLHLHKSEHSLIHCLTEYMLSHAWHQGGYSHFQRWTRVTYVCPVCHRAKMVSYFLVQTVIENGLDRSDLILTNLILVWLDHRSCQTFKHEEFVSSNGCTLYFYFVHILFTGGWWDP